MGVLSLVAAVVGFGLGLVAHDLAAQSLLDLPLRPLQGACPQCGTDRGWTRLVCPRCHRKVRRELLVGSSTAIASGFFAGTVGPHWALVAYLGFALLTTALMVTDVDTLRIVDRLNIRGSAILIGVLGLAALADGQLPEYGLALLGGFAYFSGTLVLFLIVRGRGFGAGDVKLAPLLGVFTTYFGWSVQGRALVSTAVIGGVLALVAILVSAAKRDTELPYGPAMILGAWVAIGLVGIGV